MYKIISAELPKLWRNVIIIQVTFNSYALRNKVHSLLRISYQTWIARAHALIDSPIIAIFLVYLALSLSHTSIHRSTNMATISRTSTKLFRKIQFSPVLTRNFSNVKSDNSLKKILTTCVCVAGGGFAFYAVNKYGRKNTVYALKAKVSHYLMYYSCISALLTLLTRTNVYSMLSYRKHLYKG